MAYLQRDGVNIHYHDHGAHTAQSSGRAVLLSHGYSATSNMWAGQVAALAGYRLITWDMRGHGQSDSPDDPAQYSAAHTVADMAALLDHLGEAHAVIGGLSLGGYISLAFRLTHPERTRALMLFDTGPGFRNEVARDQWNRTAFARADSFARDGLASLGSGAEVRAAEHRSARGLGLAARGMLAQFDSRVIDTLADIRVPTLVLVGAEDKAFLAGTDYMARKIPGAHKVVVAHAGHAANIDQPAAFNTALLDFLTALPA